jgi:NAD(P)-dependent dehydrogenase (short-subunit alcohol dehydrogenase family)
MSKKVFAEFKGIEVLVNNAAVRKTHTFFVDTDPLDCELEFRVAVFGTMNCCRIFLPSMIQNSFGKIINIGTDAARVGQERECNYSAAKGAILSFTKSLAKEVGRNNINVNAVSPGATNAPMRQERIELLKQKIGEEKVAEREEKVKKMYALRRIGEPEDVANTVVYLASEPARHITGQILSVNGGYAMVG